MSLCMIHVESMRVARGHCAWSSAYVCLSEPIHTVVLKKLKTRLRFCQHDSVYSPANDIPRSRRHRGLKKPGR